MTLEENHLKSDSTEICEISETESREPATVVARKHKFYVRLKNVFSEFQEKNEFVTLPHFDSFQTFLENPENIDILDIFLEQ